MHITWVLKIVLTIMSWQRVAFGNRCQTATIGGEYGRVCFLYLNVCYDNLHATNWKYPHRILQRSRYYGNKNLRNDTTDCHNDMLWVIQQDVLYIIRTHYYILHHYIFNTVCRIVLNLLICLVDWYITQYY